MKNKTYSILGVALATVCIVLTSAFVTPDLTLSTDACGIFALGDQKVDLAGGERTKDLSSKDLLIANIKAGIRFNGSGTCAGYEINSMDLTILTDKESVKYEYDFDMIREMQSMEDYMLQRFFNDARSLNFHNIQLKNAAGQTLKVPDVTFQLN